MATNFFTADVSIAERKSKEKTATNSSHFFSFFGGEFPFRPIETVTSSVAMATEPSKAAAAAAPSSFVRNDGGPSARGSESDWRLFGVAMATAPARDRDRNDDVDADWSPGRRHGNGNVGKFVPGLRRGNQQKQQTKDERPTNIDAGRHLGALVDRRRLQRRRRRSHVRRLIRAPVIAESVATPHGGGGGGGGGGARNRSADGERWRHLRHNNRQRQQQQQHQHQQQP